MNPSLNNNNQFYNKTELNKNQSFYFTICSQIPKQ